MLQLNSIQNVQKAISQPKDMRQLNKLSLKIEAMKKNKIFNLKAFSYINRPFYHCLPEF